MIKATIRTTWDTIGTARYFAIIRETDASGATLRRFKTITRKSKASAYSLARAAGATEIEEG